MKKLLASIILSMSLVVSFSAEKKVKSKIDGVTVFLSGAQINRSASVTVPSGHSEIVFTGVSPLLKRESLQAGSKSNITILSVMYETKVTEKPQEKGNLKGLESDQNAIQKKITRLNAKLEVIRTQETMIQNLAQIQNQKKDFTVADVVKAKEVIDAQLEDIKLNRIETQELINTENAKLREINQKIQAFGQIYSEVEPRVVVKVKSDKQRTAKITIGYFVQNARWYPSYNLRVKDLNSPLVIDYQANVSQQTGEDWTNVDLTLSTNDPNLGGIKPKLTPWYLILNQNNNRRGNTNVNRYTPNQFTHVSGRITDQYGDPLPFANVSVTGSTVGTISDGDGYYSLNMPIGKSQISVTYIGYNTVNFNVAGNTHNIVLAEKYLSLEEVTVVETMEIDADYGYSNDVEENVPLSLSYDQSESYTVYDVESKRSEKGRKKDKKPRVANPTYSQPVQVTKSENVVSAEFKIEEKYTIQSNNKYFSVSIDEIEHKAFYQYYCAPKLDPDVFLTAQLTDWEDLNLLEGSANIFFEGTYVGSSLLDARFVGDTMDISLGRDKRIVVERTKEKEFSKKKVIGDNETKSIKWNIEVKNQKKAQINLIVEDQFPLSNDAKIKIDKDKVSKATIDETTGFITWELKIGAGKSQKVGFNYKVTYPKGNQVYLE